MTSRLIPLFSALLFLNSPIHAETVTTDVCIYGGRSAGKDGEGIGCSWEVGITFDDEGLTFELFERYFALGGEAMDRVGMRVIEGNEMSASYQDTRTR